MVKEPVNFRELIRQVRHLMPCRSNVCKALCLTFYLDLIVSIIEIHETTLSDCAQTLEIKRCFFSIPILIPIVYLYWAGVALKILHKFCCFLWNTRVKKKDIHVTHPGWRLLIVTNNIKMIFYFLETLIKFSKALSQFAIISMIYDKNMVFWYIVRIFPSV